MYTELSLHCISPPIHTTSRASLRLLLRCFCVCCTAYYIMGVWWRNQDILVDRKHVCTSHSQYQLQQTAIF
ncbi:hypothetical protein I7I50_08943 [Histoplasma capsulatum G186AR]|uniref:Uncharacterized protein n=1 Tax=Ajellomyces capsulatus TaxID=5037 RepID=A0A8H7YUM3_AJECA|nr:hypothetical protein I7I52_06459 [Histoplasma capsulatum]QSS73978.1 hypothetical protein I7I50_08943 [Histoplasma capsulatum G186AR]